MNKNCTCWKFISLFERCLHTGDKGSKIYRFCAIPVRKRGCELASITVTDKNGDKLTLTEKSGKYTFTMPASAVTVKATFAEIEAESENAFVDVADDAYYYDAVIWAAEEGITSGTDATHFSPDAIWIDL